MNLREKIRARIRQPAEKRRYVRSLFARIARRYDLTNDVMSLGLHRRWKRWLLEFADIRPGHVVLDLAAGTGDLALGAARRAGAGGRTVAADLTPEMLRAGRERDGAGGVRWMACDALALPFAEASFHRVVIGYGLRNFPDLERSLRELFRCLKPGGRLVTLDFGKPPHDLLRKGYLRYLDISTAAVGRLLHQDPEAYAYIPESLRAYPRQEAVSDLMGRTGFIRFGWVDLLFGTMALHFGQRPPAPSRSPRTSRA